MRDLIPRVAEWFITLLDDGHMFVIAALVLTGVAYVVALVILNMRS